MNERFFLSEADGHLYRDGDLSAPFRKGMVKWNSQIKTVSDLKGLIRAADRAFGCTSLVLIMDDGETLCNACAHSEFRRIAEAVRDKDNTGWRAVSACMDNETGPCECANCGDTIVDDEEEADDEPNFDDDFVDSDPWRGGPEGDMFG